VKLEILPQIGKIWVNSNRLNQLSANGNCSTQIWANWNSFIKMLGNFKWLHSIWV